MATLDRHNNPDSGTNGKRREAAAHLMFSSQRPGTPDESGHEGPVLPESIGVHARHLPGASSASSGMTTQGIDSSVRNRTSIPNLLNDGSPPRIPAPTASTTDVPRQPNSIQTRTTLGPVLEKGTPGWSSKSSDDSTLGHSSNKSGVGAGGCLSEVECCAPNIDCNGSIQIGAAAILEKDTSFWRQQKRRRIQRHQQQQRSDYVPYPSLDRQIASPCSSPPDTRENRAPLPMQDMEDEEVSRSGAPSGSFVAHNGYEYQNPPYTTPYPYGPTTGQPANGSSSSLDRQGRTSRTFPFTVPQAGQAYYDKLPPRRFYDEQDQASSSGFQISHDLGTEQADHSYRARGGAPSLRLQSRAFHPYAASSSSSTRPSPRRTTHPNSPTAGQASPQSQLKNEHEHAHYGSKFSSRDSLNQVIPASGQYPGFELFCRQQPLHARMCGFGEKDRRPLDPPPIVQCFLLDSFGKRMTEPPRDPFLTVHATLWNEDGSDERNLIETSFSRKPSTESVRENDGRPAGESKGKTRLSRVLMGSLVASPILLEDEHGVLGSFHIFPDLSIRTEGSYRLKFTLFSMNILDLMTPGSTTTLIGECVTDTFVVYSAKKFPGMHKSTDVSILSCSCSQSTTDDCS